MNRNALLSVNTSRQKQSNTTYGNFSLIIELIRGALGGNVAGAAIKKPLYNLMIISHSFAKVASTI